MTTVAEIRKGLEILEKNSKDPHIYADDDIIYAGVGIKLQPEDYAEMYQLNWFWEDDSWQHFV